MSTRVSRHRAHAFAIGTAALALAFLAMQGRMAGQGRGQAQGQGQGRGNQAPLTGKAAAAFDPTGYWSSVVTQNWRLRMVPPAKGDYIGIPVSLAAKKAADAWDLKKDEAAGMQCKAYGAPGLMNLPTHLHITWQDDDTLRVDTDYGTQTRLLHFGNWTSPAPAKRTWQGSSVATWAPRRGGRGGPQVPKYLRIATTDLLSGYLRKNGVPYAENAKLLEYVDMFPEPNGGAIIIWTAVVEDSVNLETPYIITSQFKKVADGSAWEPTPCSAGW